MGLNCQHLLMHLEGSSGFSAKGLAQTVDTPIIDILTFVEAING
jgi:hypothetical protein